MRYREIRPRGAAARFVDCYWLLEHGHAGAPQRVVPDGAPELILNFVEPLHSPKGGEWRPQPAAFLAGQISIPLWLRAAGPARVLGIRFKPQGAGQALGIPMAEVTDRIVPVSDLSKRLDAAVGAARSNIGLFRQLSVLEAFFETLSDARDSPIPAAVSLLDRGVGIDRVATSLGISVRQLQRRFLCEVGIPPSLYRRMRRFQRVFPAIEHDPDWARVAVQCGYFDQAHLIRDCREFAGDPPAALFARVDLARHFLAHSRTPSDFSRTGFADAE
jgi:AraC-like DNA-binding protein